MTSERDIQRAIMIETHSLVDWHRNNVGVARISGYTVRYGVGGNGGSDLIGILRGSGRFIACEVKRPGQKPTIGQKKFIDRINRAGGLAFVATSVEDVLEAIK